MAAISSRRFVRRTRVFSALTAGLLLAACGASNPDGPVPNDGPHPDDLDASPDPVDAASPVPRTWSEVPSGTGIRITDLWFGPDGTGLATTEYVGVVYPAVLRYDGTTWSTLGNAGCHCELFGVWGTRSGDAWYVGGDAFAGSGQRTIGRVVGTGTTTPTATPTTSFAPGWFTGIGGTATNDVWALASSGPSQHWDGTQWSDAAIYGNRLYVAGAGDIWVVQPTFDASTLVHVVSGATTEVPPPSGFGTIEDLHGTGSTELWIVSRTQLGRWDGAAWTTYPRPAGVTAQLLGVWAVSPTEVWAVGTSGIVLRWDGAAWFVDRPESAGANTLVTVTTDASGRVWAAGVGGTMIVGTAN